MKDPIDVIAFKLSNVEFFRRNNSKEVTEYRIAIGINMVGVILITALASQLLNTYNQALIAMLSFFILRKFSGGFHFKSLTVCMLSTAGIFISASLIAIPTSAVIIINLISMILIWRLAPNNLIEAPKMIYPYLKLFSLIIVAANLYFINSSAALSFLVQSLLLIPTREVNKK